jgi:hypothetical protein
LTPTRRLTSSLLVTVALAGCARGPQKLGSGRVPPDGDPAAVARGEQTLLGRTYGYGFPFYRLSSLMNLWKVWGLPARPADFDAPYEGMSDGFLEKYNTMPWYSAYYKARTKRDRPPGYVAPPLDGLWATAPYLHNGAVPTVLDLLTDPRSRPGRYYRQPTTELSAFDPDKLGWKVTVCPPATCSERLLPYPRMVFDTTRRGLGNSGHTWGVDLTAEQKRDLIEFLKTL